MREALQKREGKRGRFTGTVKRFGTKPAYKGPPSLDYKLSHGTQFKKVGSIPVDVVGLPLFQGHP
jgi:hypothetical protein